MDMIFEELDYRPTPIGALSVRRRTEPLLKVEVIEIKLGDEFLMSSLFTDSEVALARQGLAAFAGQARNVVVGGLGLGYTARTVLEDSGVQSLLVVDFLEAVIDWHQSGLLPLGPTLTGDPRCRFVHGDFFAMARSETGFDPGQAARRFDAILVDIDHSPEALLDPRSTSFYQPDGLRALSRHLVPGGVFGLWSNEPPDEAFITRLREVFADAWGEEVTFYNPLQDRPFTQSVYLARTAG
ncbi:spermidine synthase [Oleiagrimonas sp. C23AA]|uniref:spermidine synthase n=1 Tax=Oleiagrimonas sp. C23AA TaxID=2719047 RepID=UPI001421DAA3|nr:spermidine synthase [Oleiagrimonas sp. C23AA]NII09704.1 spermidine synthase [Oleiagrimonas sp. C23AA]